MDRLDLDKGWQLQRLTLFACCGGAQKASDVIDHLDRGHAPSSSSS